MNQLEKTSAFWDSNPCDGQDSFAERETFRYSKEPWLRPVIKAIASRHSRILEVGCGQGTDALTFCRAMATGGSYTGVDYSEESVRAAVKALEEVRETLTVIPKFSRENAESLSFPENSFEAVYSMGVLHHTPDTPKSIREVHRVLMPGGKAYIILYRTLSAKLLGAHLARGVQFAFDKLLGTDRCLLSVARKLPTPKSLGTAVQECFGVPVLRSYTRGQINDLFAGFKTVKATVHGSGLPPGSLNEALEDRLGKFGYFWLVECEK